jgi:hypothetical protein
VFGDYFWKHKGVQLLLAETAVTFHLSVIKLEDELTFPWKGGTNVVGLKSVG